MARYHGVIGFGETTELTPGEWVDQVIERPYFGDVVRNARRLGGGDKVNSNVLVTNQISVVADAYANETFHAIRYISWMNQNWIVTEVEVERPRLILTLGGVYNGQTASSS